MKSNWKQVTLDVRDSKLIVNLDQVCEVQEDKVSHVTVLRLSNGSVLRVKESVEEIVG